MKVLSKNSTKFILIESKNRLSSSWLSHPPSANLFVSDFCSCLFSVLVFVEILLSVFLEEATSSGAARSGKSAGGSE